MSDPKLIDRVLKLYALAAGTSFDHEAATARAMAEALIAKHNISLPSVKDRTAFDSVDYWPHFKGARWEWLLANWAAKACGCDAFFNTVGEELSKFALVGTVADLETCQYLLAMLHEQRMRDWMRAKREGSSDSFYSFCFSFVRGVEQNIRARLTSHERERTEQAHLWWDKQCGGIKMTDLGIHGDGRSEAGRAAGRSASLHRGNLGGVSEMKKLPRVAAAEAAD
jgi:hypothetical protein